MTLFRFTKKVLAIISFLIAYVYSFAQNEPVSQAANSMVDLLTGDFHYELPVMTVPGPNGENVPIVFSYRGGIRMDQEASWIGLGWNYNSGEITRSVRGCPDDWNGSAIIESKHPSPSQENYLYGPLYFGNLPRSSTSQKMDVYSSAYGTKSANYEKAFTFPDYDDFYVSGPGISGRMNARVFSWGDFYVGDVSPFAYGINPPYFPPVNPKRVHFYLDSDNNQARLAQDAGKYNGGYPNVYVAANNRAATGNYIEYFTNQEINTSRTSLKGFLDYRPFSAPARSNTDFDMTGIGAFQITTPDGMMYHYSLPVYRLENENSISFSLDNNFNVINDGRKSITKVGRYATSWKLTAVTGPDYKDLNANGIADIGDSGYWIAYSYGVWQDKINWRYPFYNYNLNAYNKPSSSRYFKDRPSALRNFVEKFEYKPLTAYDASVSSGSSQSYYLNYIQTATHTAYFVKEIRLDNHSVKINPNDQIIPSLKLNRIVLLRNEDLSVMTTQSATLPTSPFPAFNTSYAQNIVPHIGNYTANQVLIKEKCMGMVELTTNYSLCKLVHNNIHNLFNTTIGDLYTKENGLINSTSIANSGKLTLLKVKIIQAGYGASTPPYSFDYGSGEKNPDYNLFKADFWGYYKNDYDPNLHNRYVTQGANGSYRNTDAWSLRRIVTPLNGQIFITYESDKYEKANYGGPNPVYDAPRLTFLIKNTEFDQSTLRVNKIGVDKEINKFLSLTTADTIPKINSRRVFLPFMTTTSNSNCQVAFQSIKKDSCSGCPGVSPLTMTSSGSTASVQQVLFNYALAPLSTCAANEPSKTLVYDPALKIHNIYQRPVNDDQGWGYVRLTLSFAYGGGIRVKQITFRDTTFKRRNNLTENVYNYVNEYTYQDGAAGSEPLDIYDYGTSIGANRNAGDPHAAPVGVTYGKVTVRSKGMNGLYNGRTEYEFDNKVETYRVSDSTTIQIPTNGGSYNAIVNTTYTAYEEAGSFGKPLRVTTVDNNNNIVSKITYSYLNDYSISPSYTESFSQELYDEPQASSHNFFRTIYKKTKINKRLNTITTYQDGITTKELFTGFDAYTGEVTKKQLYDPSSGFKEIQTRFAYSDYAGMGPKALNANNCNQLTSVSKQVIIQDQLMRDISGNLVTAGNPTTIGGSKTTWRQTIPVRTYKSNSYVRQDRTVPFWLPHKTFRFNGDANDLNWREESEVTLFNNRYQPLEIKSGVSNRYAASKTGYNQAYELCSAGNVKYEDIAFTSFEDKDSTLINFEGEFTKANQQELAPSPIPKRAHSGDYIVNVPANADGPGYYTKTITSGRTYRVSVWVNNLSPDAADLIVTLNGNANGTPVNLTSSISKSNATNIKMRFWTLMTLTIDVPANFIASTSTGFSAYVRNNGSTAAYFDDFMIRPIDVDLSGIAMDRRTGRTLAILDKQDALTKYEYNSWNGQLFRISSDEKFGGTKPFITKKTFTSYIKLEDN
jgi:hypothetical protein